MRRWTVCPLVVFLLLIFGCDEDGARTKIVLQDFTNNSGYTVYATASSTFFTPGDSLSLDLDTVFLSDASTRDLVLLDETGVSSETFYLYIFADTDGNQQLDDGSDWMIPVLEIQTEPGSTVVLSDIVFDDTSSYTLNSSDRFWITLDYELGLSVDSYHPVYIIMQLQGLGSDLSSSTANQNYTYARFTDIDAVQGVVAFLTDDSHYIYAYYDTNDNGIPDSGDYGSESDPTNVTTLISSAGDVYVDLSIENSGLIP